MVALTHRKGRQLAELAQAMAQRIDLMAAGDRHQGGAVRAIGLVSAVDRRAPVRGTADHRRGQHPSDIARGDQVLGVIDRRRHLALQADRMPDAPALRRIEHPHRLIGVAAERPLAIDMLPGLDRGHHRPVMIGHLHADRD